MKEKTKKEHGKIYRFLYGNTGLAAVVLVVMILLSVFLGSNLSLWSIKRDVMEQYEKDGIGALLSKAVISAELLDDLARNHGISSEKLLGAVEVVENSQFPFSFSSGSELDGLFRYSLTVYKGLKSSEMLNEAEKKDAGEALRYLCEIMAALSEKEGYLESAQRYNRAVSAPLAAFLSVADNTAAVDFGTFYKTYHESYEAELSTAETVSGGDIFSQLSGHISGIFDGIGNPLSLFEYFGVFAVVIAVIGFAVFLAVAVVVFNVLIRLIGAFSASAFSSGSGNGKTVGTDKSNKNQYSSTYKQSFRNSDKK